MNQSVLLQISVLDISSKLNKWAFQFILEYLREQQEGETI